MNNKNVRKVDWEELMAGLCDAQDVQSQDCGAFMLHSYCGPDGPVVAIENPASDAAQYIIQVA